MLSSTTAAAIVRDAHGEPGGAVALAAVLFGRLPIASGERVCVVASGGNVDMGRLGDLIAAAAPLPVA